MKRWLYSCRVEPPLFSVDVPQGRCTDISISAFFSTTLHHVEPEGLRFHVKPDAVWVRHALVGHVCRTVVEACRFRNRAGVWVTRTCLDTPPERSVLASRSEDGASRHTGFSVFHVKPTSELSVPRANGRDSTVPSFGERRASNAWRRHPRSSASSSTHGKQ